MKTELAAKHGELEFSDDTADASLMDSLLANGLPVASSCRGDGVCTKCRLHVRPLEPNAVNSPSDFERGLLKKIGAEADERISCQTKVLGLIEVDADYW
ncbi:MAG: (2Fe-2S)-binding protein [Deltaproteobacteria bacterium]|nr:(2Fe-2S)-binding protein [Deltaproteobacteria bacterium]